MTCDLACALANQGTLYIAAIVPAAAIMFLVVGLFAKMGFTGFGLFFGFCLALVGTSIAQVLPWFVTIPVIAVSSFVVLQNRRKG